MDNYRGKCDGVDISESIRACLEQSEWLIDTGATTIIVPDGDCCIRQYLKGNTTLITSNGSVKVKRALLFTPIGLREGLVSDSTPRLLPAKFFVEFQDKTLTSVHTKNGKEWPVKFSDDGVPVLAFTSIENKQDSNEPKIEKKPSRKERRNQRYRTRKNKKIIVSTEKDEDGEIIEEHATEFFEIASDPGTEQKAEQSVADEDISSPLQPREIIFTSRPSCDCKGATKCALANPAVSAGPAELENKDDHESPAAVELKSFQPENVKATEKSCKNIKNPYTHLDCGCEFCRKSKMQKATKVRRAANHENLKMAKVVCDLCTDMPSAKSGETVLFVAKELRSGLVYCKPLRGKINCAAGVRQFVAFLRESKIISETESWECHSDLGGEFESTDFRNAVTALGGISTYVPKGRHLGDVEVTVRLFLNGVRVFLYSSGLSSDFWNFAALAFAHNYNMDNQIYADTLTERGSPCFRAVFGELVFAKLDLKQGSKVEANAQPCASLGLDPLNFRRGIHLAYRNKSTGKISTTSVDIGNGSSGIVFSDGKMAFKRVVRDLKELTIEIDRRDGVDEKSSGYEKAKTSEIMEWLKRTPSLKTGRQGPDLNNSCMACRGKKRRHSYKDDCRLNPVNVLREAERKAAAEKAFDDSDEEDVVSRALVAQNIGTRMLEVDVPVAADRNHHIDNCSDGSFMQGDQIFSGLMKNDINNQEIEELGYIDEAIHQWRIERDSAYVTRKMNSDEKRSVEGQSAQIAELKKLASYGLFDRPIDRSEIRDEKATECSICMLTHVKHAERSREEQVFKGRAVILGNQLIYVKSRQPIKQSESFWSRMTSELVNLEESRIIDSVACAHGFRIESIDLESAYLQAAWPSGVPSHYVSIPKELWGALPEELQPQPGTSPLWRMARCGYGHPASGHVWLDVLLGFLKSKGFKEFGTSGSKALLKRKNCLIGVYVDDVKACGPSHELRELWADISSRFQLKEEPKICREFLGIDYAYDYDGPEYNSIIVSQEDYERATVLAYEQEFKKVVQPRRTPQTASIRPGPFVVKTIPDRRNQVLIGRLLWLARCTRPDLSEAVSELGSRVSSWDENCSKELENIVGYLKATIGTKLTYRWPKKWEYSKMEYELHSDSDWALPRSQSGFFCAVTYQGDPNAMLPVHWSSRKQSLCADSSATAELLAGHFSVKNAYPILDCFRRYTFLFFQIDEKLLNKVSLLFDNSTAISHTTKPSGSFEVYAKATGTKLCMLRDLHLAGLYNVLKVDTLFNRADPFTKAPKAPQDVLRFTSLIGLVLPPGWHNKSHRKGLWAAAHAAMARAHIALSKRVIQKL